MRAHQLANYGIIFIAVALLGTLRQINIPTRLSFCPGPAAARQLHSFAMRLLLLLDPEQKSGAIGGIYFCRVPKSQIHKRQAGTLNFSFLTSPNARHCGSPTNVALLPLHFYLIPNSHIALRSFDLFVSA